MIATSEVSITNPVWYIVHTVIDLFGNLTAMVGLTPMQFAMVIGGLIGVCIAYTFVQSLRGKGRFSLEPDSPVSDE